MNEGIGINMIGKLQVRVGQHVWSSQSNLEQIWGLKQKHRQDKIDSYFYPLPLFHPLPLALLVL